MKTSLLLSIYHKNTVEELNRCFESIKTQNDIPNEIIFIIDGPIEASVFNAIKKWNEILPLKFYELQENMGLAHALNHGMKFCANDWVFRMDIDDVCARDRFTKQLKFIDSNPDIDILGGKILCFESFPNLFPGRAVPATFRAIQKFIKYRNPLNHPSVFFNRKKIMEIGGYPDARLGQDYLLWINAMINGLKIQNTEDVLVYMQADKNSYSRRGLRNLKYDAYPYLLMYQHKMSNIFEFLIGLTIRFIYCSYCSIRAMFKL